MNALANQEKFQSSRVVTSEDQYGLDLKPSFRKNTYFSSSRTENNSPKQSTTRIHTENDSNGENLDTQNSIRIAELLEEEREKNAILTSETVHLKNQLFASTALNSQLVEQKNKIIHELRALKENYANLQEEKVVHLEKVSQHKAETDRLSAQLSIQQQQVYRLDWENRKNVEEINFQKSIESDMKKEVLLLRNKVSYMASFVKQYSSYKEQMKQAEKINVLITEKLKKMEKDMSLMKVQLKQHKRITLETAEIKNRIFQRCCELDEENKVFQKKSEIVLAEFTEKLESMQSQFSKNNFQQKQYKKIIQTQQDKIKSLIDEMTLISRKNTQLFEEIDFYKKTEEKNLSASSLPWNPIHTNSSYVTKIVRENHEQVREIRQILYDKDDQINRLEENLKLAFRSLQAKDEEIEMMKKIAVCEQKAGEVLKENQNLDLKQKNNSLTRKVDEMASINKKLKEQMAEKDRIIMSYVQSQKERRK